MNTKILSTTKAILTACCLLLLNISVKSQSNSVTVGNMGTGYVTATSPFNNYYNYSWADNIYLTTEIGQAGKITQIAYYVYEGANYSMSSQKILMRETSVSSFSNSAYPGETGFTTVFNGTITYNFSGASGWQVITLTTPFTYSGSNNLEILCENNSGTYTNNYNFFDVSTGYSSNRIKTDYKDASFPSSCANCGAYGNLTNIQLTMTCANTMSLSPTTVTICNGSSTTLSASGESTYTWSPSTGLSGSTGSSVTANPTSTTAYVVTGKDAGNCVQTGSVTVTVNPLPTISVNPSAPTICTGSSTTLTASGASTYVWSPSTGLSVSTGASVTANPTSTTTYTVTGTNSNGCVKSQTVVVTVNTPSTLTFSPSAPAVCVGGTVAITGSGASTYTWSPSTGLNTTTGASVNASPSATTTYSINATGSNGCTGTQTLAVTVNPLPTLTLSPSSPAVCNGGNTSLTASGATTYTWSPSTGLSATTGASVTANPTIATNYTLTGTNANGCLNTKAFSVGVNSLPSLSISPATATICIGNNTSLTASGATTYTWSPSTGINNANSATVTANPSSTTTYTVSGTNANGCVGTTTITVNVNPLPTLSITASPTAICVGANSNLTASGASSYTWSPASGLSATTGASVTANPNATTLYTASGTNTNGCVGTQTVNLIVNPLPSISVNPQVPVVLGGQGPIITANGASTYSWSPSTNLSSTSGSSVTATPQITTAYTLTGTSSAGCANNTVFSVGVELWQQTADSAKAPIYYQGNVGIGNNNPQMPLDVKGNARVSGNLYVGGGFIESTVVSVINSLNTDSVNSLSGVVYFADTIKAAKPLIVSNNLDVKSLSFKGTPAFSFTAGTVGTTTTAPSDSSLHSADKSSGNQLSLMANTNVKGNLSVAGAASFDNLDAGSSLGLAGGSAFMSYRAASGTNTYNTIAVGPSYRSGTTPGQPGGGLQPPPFFPQCFAPPVNSTVFQVQSDIMQITGSGNTSISNQLAFGVTGIGGLIELSGTSSDPNTSDRLLINYNCGKDVFICTGTGLSAYTANSQGTAGGFVQTGPNLEIGNPSPRNSQVALNVVSMGTTAMNLANSSNQSIFSVVNDGSTLISSTANSNYPLTITNNQSGTVSNIFQVDAGGYITSAALASSSGVAGFRNLSVDATGKIVVDPTGVVGSAWQLGGNAGTFAGGISQAIGATDAQADLPFLAGGSEKMRIDASGNVLINTATSTSPNYKKTLTVNGDVCFANYNSTSPTDIHANDGANGIEILGMNKTPTSRGISTEPDPNGDFNFYINSWEGGSGLSPAEFNFKSHNPSDGIKNLMTLNASGQLILGASSTDANKPSSNSSYPYALLQVKGDVVVGTGSAANIYVTQNGWADFVFDKNYKLMPLSELEVFYKQNHHLPNVPTTKDIQEKGNNLGQTDVVLLQKIEELTLYMVEQQKALEKLSKYNSDMEEQMKSLKMELEKVKSSK